MKHCKILFFLLAVCLSVTLAACGPVGNGVKVSRHNGMSGSQTKHLTEKLGNSVDINAVVHIPANIRSVPLLYAKPVVLDPAKVKNLLLSNLPVAQKRKNADGSMEYIAYDNTHDGQGNVYLYGGYPVEDSRLLMCGGSEVLYMTRVYNYIFNAFHPDDTCDAYDANLYSKTREFAFATQSEALQKIAETLKPLGIDVSAVCDVYSLDHDTMANREGTMGKFSDMISLTSGQIMGKTGGWTEHDDSYYFILHPQYHGIPITEGNGLEIPGSGLTACYSERGFEYLLASNIYKESGVKEQNVPVYGLDGALQALRHKFDETILSSPAKVTEINFCYVPQSIGAKGDSVVLEPAWSFSVTQTIIDNKNGNTKRTENVIMAIDAVTGKEITGASPRL